MRWLGPPVVTSKSSAVFLPINTSAGGGRSFCIVRYALQSVLLLAIY